ncbi:HAD family hydrolase [Spirosoma agri]|uniref:phosphoglycolate phosphatase n=1 Tax=Spirosoma agri TaxID=1987381 RepID=A0A6M0ISD1_9BACT|nr:HAD-IA family hydrolase [Spirosoma agri]NEU70907.1 HAD-IA family hydrolase [Spirosoma agri]
MPSLILDLDQTLIDTSSAQNHRKPGGWQTAYGLIPSFIIYDGIAEIFQYIKDKKIKVCIVTTSPSIYCGKVLTHWSIPHDHMICYHDVKRIKPDPEGFLKAIQLLGDNPANILSLGDRAIDIKASKAANVETIGCLWGSAERQLVIDAKPEYLAETAHEALAIVKSKM